MKKDIIKILEQNAKEGWNGDTEAVGYTDFNSVAEQLVKLFAIPVVINWVKLEDEEPDGKDKYWCVDASGSLYLCKYEQFMFRRKKQFTNCIGRGWPVDDIVKWQKLILPCL